ncbi:hypothetical protein EDD21DRAFT_141170 [Dissophora ornata]|nr:hypothetical protein EDD21DRAFT_141170 [Dissophora ornata]
MKVCQREEEEERGCNGGKRCGRLIRPCGQAWQASTSKQQVQKMIDQSESITDPVPITQRTHRTQRHPSHRLPTATLSSFIPFSLLHPCNPDLHVCVDSPSALYLPTPQKPYNSDPVLLFTFSPLIVFSLPSLASSPTAPFPSLFLSLSSTFVLPPFVQLLVWPLAAVLHRLYTRLLALGLFRFHYPFLTIPTIFVSGHITRSIPALFPSIS